MPKKILLADDSITIQKVVELTFSDGDYEVTAVNNGAKAVQKLAELRPDIILSDIIMPEKNGYEVCEYVKSHPEFRNIPVVLLTGTFEPFDPDRAEKAGCDAVVTKPFESQSLIHKVEELIAQARANVAAPAAAEPEALPASPAASPWVEETPSTPAGGSPFGGGSFSSAPDAFTHDADIFGAAPPPAPSSEMPFESQGESPFGAPPPAEEFSGETRAFPRMSFDEMQQMAGLSTPPAAAEEEPVAAPTSPWDDQPETAAFSGETRAFPSMSFDDLASQSAAGAAPEGEPESPFGASTPAEEFSGETRAFPRMSFEELQQMAQPAASAPPPEPESLPWEEPATQTFTADAAADGATDETTEVPIPTAPEPSPWDEQPASAFSGETRAFPKMSFEEMQAMASQSAPSQDLEPAPWEQPAAPAFPAWSEPVAEPEAEEPVASPEPSYSANAFETPAFEAPAVPEDLPFSAEASAVAEDSYIDEVPPPESEPAWAPAAAAEAEAERVEPAVPASASAFASEPAQIPIARGELTDEQVDRIARRVVELMSDQVVRNIAWEVIPDLAEVVVKERIRQLESEA